MRTESRELLAVGIFGSKSRIGDRIEMLLRPGRTFSPRASIASVAASAIVLGGLMLAGSLVPRWIAFAQQPDLPKFDVASVKPSKSDANLVSNVRLGPGDGYTPNGGFFSATGVPLAACIAFAYEIPNQSARLPWPAWVYVDRFDIQARASGNPGKDQMRLMMRSLLADRFKLAIHYEPREVSVFALVLAKPGKTGPQLQPHPDNSSCSTTTPCGDIFFPAPSVPGHRRIGARSLTMGLIANLLTNPELGRPLLDRTGLTGTFDFTLEWTPNVPPDADFRPDESGPTYQEALKEQLGLKLDSEKGKTVDTIVIDHVEKPDAN